MTNDDRRDAGDIGGHCSRGSGNDAIARRRDSEILR
jgi:hypothetical protein